MATFSFFFVCIKFCYCYTFQSVNNKGADQTARMNRLSVPLLLHATKLGFLAMRLILC